MRVNIKPERLGEVLARLILLLVLAIITSYSSFPHYCVSASHNQQLSYARDSRAESQGSFTNNSFAPGGGNLPHALRARFSERRLRNVTVSDFDERSKNDLDGKLFPRIQVTDYDSVCDCNCYLTSSSI